MFITTSVPLSSLPLWIMPPLPSWLPSLFTCCIYACVCVCLCVPVTLCTSMLYVSMCLCDPLHFHVVCLRVCACVSVCLWTSNFIRMVYRHGGEGVLSEAWVPAKVIARQISEVGKTVVRSGRECLQSQQPELTSCGKSVWGVNWELQMAKVECGERVSGPEMDY